MTKLEKIAKEYGGKYFESYYGNEPRTIIDIKNYRFVFGVCENSQQELYCDCIIDDDLASEFIQSSQDSDEEFVITVLNSINDSLKTIAKIHNGVYNEHQNFRLNETVVKQNNKIYSFQLNETGKIIMQRFECQQHFEDGEYYDEIEFDDVDSIEIK